MDILWIRIKTVQERLNKTSKNSKDTINSLYFLYNAVVEIHGNSFYLPYDLSVEVICPQEDKNYFSRGRKIQAISMVCALQKGQNIWMDTLTVLLTYWED